MAEKTSRKRTRSTAVEVEQKPAYKLVRPRTINQEKYMASIRKHVITFANGPAGTGKTFIAINLAVDALLSGQVARIILIRPAVTAGEKYGFLPGEIDDKIAPFLVTYYDELVKRIGKPMLNAMLADGRIEAKPLGFLLGQTLDNAFILCDEMSNATRDQIKLVLTRIGECVNGDSKCVIMGDPGQVYVESNGFVEAIHILQNLPICHVVTFDIADVVRSSTVRMVLEAYDNYDRCRK